MRLATYNVEWFNGLFDDDDQLIEDDGWSARRDITRAQQADAIATVMRAVDADAMIIIEAPDAHRHRSTVKALEGFAARFDLRCRSALIGFANQTQQEIALMFDPDKLRARHDPQTLGAPAFDQNLELDLDIDDQADLVEFSKPPLEVALETDHAQLRLIGVHTKSKAPHGARTPEDVIRISIANRRKSLAQCIWLRRRIKAHLEAGDDLIVLGDLNDGPGLDAYERLFGRSGVEIVMGEGDGPQLYDPHARMALGGRLVASPSTARFFQRETGRYFQALLDYILVSPALRARAPSWKIWHPFDVPEIYADPPLRDALLTASDHFPVSLDIDL